MKNINKKPSRNLYLPLVGLLLIALILIVLYSLSDTEIKIGNFTFQKADIKKYFHHQDTLPSDTLVPVLPTQQQPLVIMDTTSQRILLFGDSMVEGLSKRLQNYAAENNHECLSVIWYSSSTKIWAETDTLEYFKRTFNPTYIMISLGGNELFVRDLDKREEYIKQIIKKFGDIPYIWIGPPNWKEDTGINDLMEKHAKPHRFFPSKNLKFDRISDGAHPTMKSAANWMDSVAVWIQNETYYRIKMDFPQSNAKKGSTILLQPLR